MKSNLWEERWSVQMNKAISLFYSPGPLIMFDFVRMFLLLALSFLLSFGVPPLHMQGTTNGAYHLLFVYSFIFGFLLYRAIERKQTLYSGIAIEQSRLRRIGHLARQLDSLETQRHISEQLLAYQRTLSESLFDHDAVSRSFRQLTGPIYGYRPKSSHEQMFYSDLLQTTRDLALERQKREVTMKSVVRVPGWIALSVIVFFIVLLLLINRAESGYSNLSVGMVISGVMLLGDLLYQQDKFSGAEFRKIRDGYRANSGRD